MNKLEVIARGRMHEALAHDSAHKHVAGSADYTDDMIEPAGTLHARLMSPPLAPS